MNKTADKKANLAAWAVRARCIEQKFTLKEINAAVADFLLRGSAA